MINFALIAVVKLKKLYALIVVPKFRMIQFTAPDVTRIYKKF